MSDDAKQHNPSTHTKWRGMTRRDMMRYGAFGALGLVVSSQPGHDAGSNHANLPETPFKKPYTPCHEVRQRYAENYARLQESIEPAAQELVAVSRQFGLLDAFKKSIYEGCHITVIPVRGHHEPACHFEMLNRHDRRAMNLPAVNQLIRACIDIKLLDEECGTVKHEGLDFDNTAAKLVNAFQRIKGPSLLDQRVMQNECRRMLCEVVKTGAAFERPVQPLSSTLARDMSASRELKFSATSSDIPVHFTVKNPTIIENQEAAIKISAMQRGR